MPLIMYGPCVVRTLFGVERDYGAEGRDDDGAYTRIV